MNYHRTHHAVPSRKWSVAMRWHDLLFMHWPVELDVLRSIIPSALAIDTFAGQAWIGVVPFHMSGIRHRCLPPLPPLLHFARDLAVVAWSLDRVLPDESGNIPSYAPRQK